MILRFIAVISALSAATLAMQGPAGAASAVTGDTNDAVDVFVRSTAELRSGEADLVLDDLCDVDAVVAGILKLTAN